VAWGLISIAGHREILGLMVGDNDSKPFGTTFLRSFRARALDNAQLVPCITAKASRPSGNVPAPGSGCTTTTATTTATPHPTACTPRAPRPKPTVVLGPQTGDMILRELPERQPSRPPTSPPSHLRLQRDPGVGAE
jgi:hypothetical protein